jgi:hypothetical protein
MHIILADTPAIDFEFPELVIISLRGLISLTILVGLADTVFAMVTAIGQRVFDAHYMLTWLVTHGRTWLGIIALGVLGYGIPALDIPPIHVAYLAAQAALALYVGNTVMSMTENARDSRSPAPQGNTWT